MYIKGLQMSFRVILAISPTTPQLRCAARATRAICVRQSLRTCPADLTMPIRGGSDLISASVFSYRWAYISVSKQVTISSMKTASEFRGVIYGHQSHMAASHQPTPIRYNDWVITKPFPERTLTYQMNAMQNTMFIDVTTTVICWSLSENDWVAAKLCHMRTFSPSLKRFRAMQYGGGGGQHSRG